VLQLVQNSTDVGAGYPSASQHHTGDMSAVGDALERIRVEQEQIGILTDSN
jgi:hypothetical protein